MKKILHTAGIAALAGMGMVMQAQAAMIAEDVIYVDFGEDFSSGNINNISSSLGALSVADAIRLSDGAATGVGVAVAQSPASSTYTEANAIAGNALYTDATACGDALGRNNSGASTMSITFTGLDTSLCYYLTGGVSVDNSIAYKYATGWTVDSIRLVSYATTSTGYITFDELTTSDGTLTITLDNDGVNHLAVSQLTLTAYDHVTQEEMMGYLDDHLSAFPEYSWDKISRWAFGWNNAAWTAAEKAIAAKCKFLWLGEESGECERFLAAYPDIMYCFNTYVNLAKAYVHPADKPEFFVYTKSGGLYTYWGDHEAYNLANPEVREWWLNYLTDLAYESPKTDVIFIDAIMKVLILDAGQYYDYWGNPLPSDYMENIVKPFLATIRDMFSEDFILLGNFIRARSAYTPDGNFSYCEEYVHGSYLENIELPDDENYVEYVHETIEYVQQAVDQGKLTTPNMNPVQPYVSADMTIEEKRAKASAAMPVFWERLGAAEQDDLAEMYAYFDMKLAIFLIMAGEQSYFRYCDAVTVETAGTDIFKLVPPFPEFERKLGAPISDGVRISDTTWERAFEYCKVTLNVDAGIADIDWSYRSDGQTENLAVGKPAYSSSNGDGTTPDRVNDGNTDGDLNNGSVACTTNDPYPWWELDLEAIREIGNIDLWNRTDNRTWLLKNVYVLVSVDPFESDDLATTLAQPGVTALYVSGRVDQLPDNMASLQVDAPGRYVRVQLDHAASLLMLAEVEVWSR